MVANDDAGYLTPRGALRFFASRARSYSRGNTHNAQKD